MPDLHTRIDNDFTYHAPKEGQPELYDLLRSKCRALAHDLVGLVPESRELSLALTNLEQVVFWANAAVARNPVSLDMPALCGLTSNGKTCRKPFGHASLCFPSETQV